VTGVQTCALPISYGNFCKRFSRNPLTASLYIAEESEGYFYQLCEFQLTETHPLPGLLDVQTKPPQAFFVSLLFLFREWRLCIFFHTENSLIHGSPQKRAIPQFIKIMMSDACAKF
jgi:hypothetical protein